jgi:hypothetical protein
VKPLCVALGVALASPAFAVSLDLSGSNIYMKFLDGSLKAEQKTGSIDTASGNDQGQFSELELRLKATISKEVEIFARILSRSSGAYWSEFGGFADEKEPIKAKNMKLRGATVTLTPGYRWLDQAFLGSSDWGMFDPFTVGKMRYIDRDNINGIYGKGSLPLRGSSYELAWISLAEYLGPNFTTNPNSSAPLRANDGTWVAQFKLPIAGARLAASVQRTQDKEKDPTDTNLFDGQNTLTRFKNTVTSIRGEGSPLNGLDLRGAYYHSEYKVNTPVETWSNLLGANYNDKAYLLTVDWSQTPLPGFGIALQHFNIGAGYASAVGARRESDVLLTEGSEAAWFGWGDPKYVGGLANTMQQVPVTIRDNDFTDFDEPGAESAIGWKGNTVLLKYDIANTPLSLEYTKLDYNQNWQNWGGKQNVFDVISWAGPTGPGFKANTDRSTDIIVFKASHVFNVAGGLDTSFRYKRVKDKDNNQAGVLADDRETKDNGFAVSVGNQLFSHLYGSVSFGKYDRDIKLGAAKFDNTKDIWSLRLNYNLPGFELGSIAQWINGRGDPAQSGTQIDLKQYRLKVYAKAFL